MVNIFYMMSDMKGKIYYSFTIPNYDLGLAVYVLRNKGFVPHGPDEFRKEVSTGTHKAVLQGLNKESFKQLELYYNKAERLF